jgi:hypothetical protein
MSETGEDELTALTTGKRAIDDRDLVVLKLQIGLKSIGKI